MNMMFRAFSKKLFGAGYERLVRTPLVCLILFWGLYLSEIKVQIAPFVLYFMTSTFTAGVMWQALVSEAEAGSMRNMLMLPFRRLKLIFAYVAVLGAYTFFTKTAALLAVVFAVSEWELSEILGSVFCAMNAVLMTAAVFSIKKYRYAGICWAGVWAAGMLLLWDTPWFLLMIAGNAAAALLRLCGADGYSFYSDGKCGRQRRNSHNRYSVWRCLFRYLDAHKNYVVNIGMMWVVACVLPLLFGNMESVFAVPIGFAILSMNTPVCILLSCDPALEEAVRFLPGQKRAFCAPYCLFIFACNIIAESLFLCGWQFRAGGITVRLAVIAVFFALLSAVCSVLLEWYCPIRDWKIESDLWHHPRKYIVPVVMLMLAAICI